MKEVFLKDIENKTVESVSCYEAGYDEFKITMKVDGEYVVLCRMETSRCNTSIQHKRTRWTPSGAQGILDKYAPGEKITFSWNHNPSTWDDCDDDYYDDYTYYGDGLDCIEELYYMD